jgi:hypothetical protein
MALTAPNTTFAAGVWKGESHVIRRIIRKTLFPSLLVLLGLGLNLSRPTAAPAQEDVTVQGEIIDMACYMAKGSKGASHKACAQLCAKRGVPIGVLTDAGEVFLLLDDHNNPDPYEAAKKLAGDRAEIAGKKFNKQGVASIVVNSAKGL